MQCNILCTRNTKCTDDRGAFTESNYQELSVLGLNVMITIIKLSLLHFAMYIELSLKAHKTANYSRNGGLTMCNTIQLLTFKEVYS